MKPPRLLGRINSHLKREGLRSLVSAAWQTLYSKLITKAPGTTISVVRLFCRIHPFRTDADPFKLIWVDPQNISSAIRAATHAWGKVESGDWDRNLMKFVDRPPNRALKSWYEDGNEQPLREALREASSNTAQPRYKQGNLDSRIEEIAELCSSLEENGYKPKQELLSGKYSRYVERVNDPMPPILDEVVVDIGRSGEFIHRRCGQHRLRLAQLLQLDSIPVLVARRHSEWQKIRDAINCEPNNVPRDLGGHPDLRDISETERKFDRRIPK